MRKLYKKLSATLRSFPGGILDLTSFIENGKGILSILTTIYPKLQQFVSSVNFY